VISLPKLGKNNVKPTLFLDFIVTIVREQFAKVREQCSPNPPFCYFGDHVRKQFARTTKKKVIHFAKI
jgi:hypothetical protein